MYELKSDNKRIAKNTIYLYIRMLFILIVSLYTSRVILSYLGVTDYGISNVVGGFISLFAFLNTSLTGAIQRFYNYEGSKRGDDGIKDVFITSCYIQIVLAVIVVIIAETIGLWYMYNKMVIPEERFAAAMVLYQVSIVSMFFVIVQIPFSSLILSLERMNYYALVGVMDVVLKLILILLMPFFPGDKLVVFSIISLILSIVNFLLYYLYAKIIIKIPAFSLRLKDFDVRLFRSMLSFSGWNFLGTFAQVGYTQGISLVLNLFFGPVINAARGVSSQIVGALRGFSINIVVAFRPQLVDSYAKNDYQRTRTIMFLEAKACYLMVLILILPIIIDIDYILVLWLGENVPDYAAIFTSLVLINLLVSSCNSPFSQVMHAVGDIKYFQIVTSIITIANIPISYVFLKRGCSPEMVFVVGIIISIISQIACVLIVKHYFKFSVRDYLVEVIFPCIIVTILSPLIPLIFYYTMDSSIIRTVTILFTSVLSSMVSTFLFAMNKPEREIVICKAKHYLKIDHK